MLWGFSILSLPATPFSSHFHCKHLYSFLFTLLAFLLTNIYVYESMYIYTSPSLFCEKLAQNICCSAHFPIPFTILPVDRSLSHLLQILLKWLLSEALLVHHIYLLSPRFICFIFLHKIYHLLIYYKIYLFCFSVSHH